LPVKKRKKTRITRIAERDETTIIYESPHRILRTLAELSAVLGLERKVSVSREIRKIFHETIRGTLSELVEWAKSKPLKGEFVIVIGGKQDAN
jgi:16S rRNA (cytidine1402-2'-O)-methyltransferase